jgi:23S rRNA (pseudouridine1915-N3)-methyltransferase
MKINIFVIGKHKDRYIAEAIADFLKKMRPLAKLDFVEVKDAHGSLPVDRILQLEYQSLLPSLSKEGKKVLLDVQGKSLSTEQAAAWIRELKDFGGGAVTFIIGGAFGVDDQLKESVDEIWSLSHFTLSHQIARVVLLEQLYRMLTLLHGIPYHK